MESNDTNDDVYNEQLRIDTDPSRTPEWYFTRYPFVHWEFRIWVGRVKEMNPGFIVFNVYLPWCSFGYAW